MATIVKGTDMTGARLNQLDHCIVVQTEDQGDLVDAVVDYWGTKPIVFLGTYDLTSTLKPEGEGGILAGVGQASVLRPADNTVTPLISLEEHKGENDSQGYMQFLNFKVDMRQYEDSDVFHLYNVRNSQFEKLSLWHFDQYGFYMEGHASVGNGATYWNTFRDIHAYAAHAPTSSDRCLFRAKNNAIDSWVDGAKGTVTDGYGFKLHGRGGWRIRRLHTVDSHALVYLYAKEHDIYDMIFTECTPDTVDTHGIILELDGYSMTKVRFDGTYFIGVGTPEDQFYMEGHAAKAFANVEILRSKDDGTAPRYNVNYDNVGSMYNTCLIDKNQWTQGATASFNNVPYSAVGWDRYFKDHQYQEKATFADPTWVGTKRNGQLCVMRQTSDDSSRLYMWKDDDWDYVAGT